ncbi:hypothetical protein [Gordonia oryzae]|uniref:hypothetical protein n=1 Tax=Gordonia oryzae TaxID=2487349 RepID=UPI00161838CC|nr:hypothetical protein [Gordonia oryzae]
MLLGHRLGTTVLGAPGGVPGIVGVVAVFVVLPRGKPEATTGLVVGPTAPTTRHDIGNEEDQADEADDDAGEGKPQCAGDQADDK